MEIVLLTVGVATLIAVVVQLLQNSSVNVRRKNAVLLDTCALIDGRIIEVVKSGFVPAELLIPRFVLAELQLLADKSDHLKRERARYGLSVVQELQASNNTDVQVISDDITEETGVDEKLVKLALKRRALLLTTDYNLLKVAEIEGVRVLNINELAQNLRPVRLPGEQATLKIVQKGQERSQGVGYLDDGTLVVVDKAGTRIGKTVDVEFTRNLQTTAGRMMFASLKQSRQSSRPDGNKSKPTASKQRSNKPSRRHSKKSAEDKLLETIAQQ